MMNWEANRMSEGGHTDRQAADVASAEAALVASEILSAIESLRSELVVRDGVERDKTVMMEELRQELHRERLRRQFLWTPIGILASVVAVVTFLFVDARADERARERLECQQTNAARSTVHEFIDRLGEQVDPNDAEFLARLADDTLSPIDCE